jgi:hypothetical protein
VKEEMKREQRWR